MVVETGLAAKAPALNNSPDRFNLAGVEYLLRLAPERLTLFHDVRAADEALANADAQLAAMDNPVYLGLRQHIADARQTLAAAELPDTIELSARLDQVQSQLSALTFGGEAAASNELQNQDGSAVDEGWWDRLKTSLSGLVTVRRNAEDAESRLTLEDKDLLRQGLWMQVEGARLALMRHDQAGWQDTLGRAQQVLERWFDSSQDEYQAISEQLAGLAEISVSPQMPDISGPWSQLQLIRQATPAPLPVSRVSETTEPPAETEPEPAAEDTPAAGEAEEESAEGQSAQEESAEESE